MCHTFCIRYFVAFFGSSVFVCDKVFMQASVVALFVAATVSLPHLWLRSGSFSPEAFGPAEVLQSEQECPECVCGPQPECPEGEAQVVYVDRDSTPATQAVGAAGLVAGAVLGTLVRHGRQDRAGVEAGAAIGDPIPW